MAERLTGVERLFYKPEPKKGPFAPTDPAVTRESLSPEKPRNDTRPDWLKNFRNPQYGERLDD